MALASGGSVEARCKGIIDLAQRPFRPLTCHDRTKHGRALAIRLAYPLAYGRLAASELKGKWSIPASRPTAFSKIVPECVDALAGM